MYATTWTAGLFASSDGGESWIQGPPGEHHSKGMLASPHNPLEARWTQQRTVDGGESWYTEHFDPDKVNTPGFEITAFLEYDPFNEDILYAGTVEGFYRTFDSGETWEHVDIGIPTVSDTECWVKAPAGQEGVVYAAFNPDNTIVRTDNRGDSWHVVAGPDDLPKTRGPIVVEQSGKTGYITSGGNGIYTFGDEPPTRVTPPFRFYNEPTLSADDERLYFIARPMDSQDNEMWQDMQLFVFDTISEETRAIEMPEKPDSIEAHPTDPSTLYFGGWSWIWESQDHGKTWTKLSNNFIDQYLVAVGVNPSHSGTMMPGSACATGLSVSHDYGETYAWKRSGLPPYHEGEFGEHYIQNIRAGGDRAYATTAAGLLISEDNGETWRLLENEFSGRGSGEGPHTPLSGLGIDPEDPSTVFVGTMLNGPGPIKNPKWNEAHIWKSHDGGERWEEVTDESLSNAITNITDIHVSPHDSNMVYAATMEGNKLGYRGEGTPDSSGFGVYKSANGGEKWRQLDTPFSNVYSLTEDAGTAGCIYVSTRHELYRSEAEGGEWERVLPYDTRAALAHPQEPGVVFVGARKYEGYWDLLISEDGGESWAEGNLTIKMGTEPGEREYDGVNRAGKWGEKGDIMDLAVDRSSSQLYAATLGDGIWQADIDRFINQTN